MSVGAMSVADSRQITVVGTGSADTVPDAAELQLGAESRAGSPGAALGECAQALAAMADALTAEGVPETALRTGRLSVRPEWHHNRIEELVGYRAETTLGVTVRDLSNAGSLATAALAAAGPAGRLHSLHFDVTDADVPMRQARAAAYADARARAEQYAGLAGVQLGDLLVLSEQVGRRGEHVGMASAGLLDAAPAMPMYAGESSVTAAVTVSWALR